MTMLRVRAERAQCLVVLPGWEPHRELIHVVCASRRVQLPAVRLLIDHLAQAVEALEEA